MAAPINAAAVAALADEPLDWRFKGLPASWWGRTPADVCAQSPGLFGAGAVGPVCVLRAEALSHNLDTMHGWCHERGVELAPHGKTHMAPQLLVRQLDAGASAVTAATISQVRVFRAFGVRDVVLANELVDEAGLRWLAAELDTHPDFGLVCWVDSVRGVETMTSTLTAAGAVRPVDVCVEVGMAGGRTGCRDANTADEVARAVAASPRLRLVGVAGYEAALGHDVGPDATRRSSVRISPTSAPRCCGWRRCSKPTASSRRRAAARTSMRSPTCLPVTGGRSCAAGATSPTTTACTTARRRCGIELRPALRVWSQVVSRPEPGLAVLTMGRRDVSFDQDLPVPYGLTSSRVVKLNDQHAYLRLGEGDRAEVGDWVEFGISHPCTVFDKWPMIPVLDDRGRVVDLIRTFF